MILILQQLVGDARLIWEKMRDYNEKKLVMTHDGYLKLYQLSRPALTRYHCILIDEEQDLTPGKMVTTLTRYHCILIDEAQDLTQSRTETCALPFIRPKKNILCLGQRS